MLNELKEKIKKKGRRNDESKNDYFDIVYIYAVNQSMNYGSQL